MANTIIGKVLVIGPIDEIPSKNGGMPFQKRDIILDCSRYDQFTGQKYENYPQFEFAGKNVSLLDGFTSGDIVEVSFVVQGRKYTKDNVDRYFTSIVGYKIEPHSVRNEQTARVDEHLGAHPQFQQTQYDDGIPF